MSSVASPAVQKPIRLKDNEVGFSYIEFPEDTFFMESLAQHPAFRSGVAYVPVQRLVDGKEESHLYEIRAGLSAAKHVAGPIAAPDGSTDVTIFGSALTSTGILYLCAFNRNSILAMDLNKLTDEPGPVTCEQEVSGLASPNDVCIDPQNESTIYVAGGVLVHCCCSCTFANSARGRVYKVVMKGSSPEKDIQADGLKTLAGIEVAESQIWLAQLFNIVHQDQKGGKTTVTWRGNDGNETVWMADNVDVFGEDMLICPAYSTLPESTVNNVMKRPLLSSTILFVVQIVSAIMHRERFRDAIRDPEVCLSFSNTYIKEGEEPAPVRLIFLKPNHPESTFHFEVDLAETRAQNAEREIKDESGKVLGKRYFFNEQVTHAAHLKNENGEGFVACVNFEQPRILLLNDKAFRDAMVSQAVVS